MAPLSFTDQMGNNISLPDFPKRIVSLVPSQTELLADLGLTEEVVGITKFCVHPPRWRFQKTVVGGTKNPDTELIKTLAPDLIIGNKEENEKRSIGVLQQEFPVWMSNINTLADALGMINTIGAMTDRLDVATRIRSSITEQFLALPGTIGKSVLYLIWRKPWMAAAANTFIDDMLSKIGLINVAGDLSRYPTLSDEEVASLSPDNILLSTEPYPFQEKHFRELKEICPRSNICLVDGEMFSWYGSRLVNAPAYFRTLALV